MLTVTETTERTLNVHEKLALDTQKVCEAFVKAYETSDRQTAIEYAKIVMLKAMSMGR